MSSVRNMLSFVILVMVFTVSGCGGGIPSGILEIDTMIPIVKDLQIAYAGVDATIQDPSKRPVKYEEMNTLILAKHQVNKETFFDSFSFYQENPVLMDSIFKNVVDQLNQEIVQMDNNGGQKPSVPAPEVK